MAIRRLLLSRTMTSMGRVAFAFLLVLLSALVASPPTASADTEPGDNIIGGANVLTMTEDPVGSGYSVGRGSGNIDPSSDVDYWSFQLQADDKIAIAVETPLSSLNVRVELHDSSDVVKASDSNNGPDNDAFISYWTVPTAGSGTYYAVVKGESSTTGSYELRVDRARGIDLESDQDYNNDTIANADPLTKKAVGNQAISKAAGYIMSMQSGAQEDEDLFSLGRLNTGNSVNLDVTVPAASSLNPFVRLLDANGAAVTDANSADKTLAATIASDGYYYAQVTNTYRVYNGHRYQWLGSMTWANAEAAAQARGAHLVTINDAAEQQWLFNTFYNVGNNLWIGLNDVAAEGTWVWSSEEALSYTNWASGQPANQASNDWDMAYMRNDNGFWNNGHTSYSYPAIIEWNSTAGALNGAGIDAYYLMTATVDDYVSPKVMSVSRLPNNGATVPLSQCVISTFTITTSEALAAGTVNASGAFSLVNAGADDTFATGDDITYTIQVSPTYTAGETISLLIANGPTAPGIYKLTMNATITDVVGNTLDGDGNGTGGDPFVLNFTVEDCTPSAIMGHKRG